MEVRQRCVRSMASSLRLNIADVPECSRDTFVLTGYRGPMMKPCMSLLSWHNETMNIWTHLFAFVFFCYVLIETCVHVENWIDGFILIYIVCSIHLFAASTCYHVYKDQSVASNRFWSKVDHVSIILLLWGSDIPMIVYGFWCQVVWMIVYLVFITILVLLSVFFITRDSSQSIRMTRCRYAVFISLCAVGWTHLLHEMMLKDFKSESAAQSLECWGRAFACYGIGFLFLVSKFPERPFPQHFDFLGASHQIWHVMVFFGALVHLQNCWIYRNAIQSTCILQHE